MNKTIFLLLSLLPTILNGATIKVISNDEKAISGASIYNKNTLIGISGSDGFVEIPNQKINRADTLYIFFIGCEVSTLIVDDLLLIGLEHKTITLNPLIYELDEVIVRSRTGMDILREKIAKGLKVGPTTGFVPFTQIDTIQNHTKDSDVYFKCSGKIVCSPIRALIQYFITNFKWEHTGARNIDINLVKENIAKEKKKNLLIAKKCAGEIIVLSQFFANSLCQFDKRIDVDYRGIDGAEEVFYFNIRGNNRMFDFDSNINRLDGMIFINRVTGVITKMKIACGAIDIGAGYNYEVYFEPSGDNMILPNKIYYLYDSIDKSSKDIVHYSRRGVIRF